MTKTPEELTADWKAGKRKENMSFYCDTKDGDIKILTSGKNDYGEIYLGDNNFFYDDDEIEIISPVPTYDEYRAMQTELAEHRENCCCLENEKLRLDKAKLEMKNNNLRDLLRECLAHLSLGKMRASVTPLNILLTRINAALGESEE